MAPAQACFDPPEPIRLTSPISRHPILARQMASTCDSRVTHKDEWEQVMGRMVVECQGIYNTQVAALEFRLRRGFTTNSLQ
jgi:hypothetical protein